MKKLLASLLCFAATAVMAVSTYATDPMEWAMDNGIILGMENNEAAPDLTVTRAQLAAIITRYCEPQTGNDVYSYSDVDETDWYKPYVDTVSSSGIMIGDSDMWRPEDNVTFEEAVTTLVRALDCQLQNEDGKEVSDKVSEWAVIYISTAESYGIISDTENIEPKHYISRYELAELVYNSYMSENSAQSCEPVIDTDGTVWTPIFVN